VISAVSSLSSVAPRTPIEAMSTTELFLLTGSSRTPTGRLRRTRGSRRASSALGSKLPVIGTNSSATNGGHQHATDSTPIRIPPPSSSVISNLEGGTGSCLSIGKRNIFAELVATEKPGKVPTPRHRSTPPARQQLPVASPSAAVSRRVPSERLPVAVPVLLGPHSKVIVNESLRAQGDENSRRKLDVSLYNPADRYRFYSDPSGQPVVEEDLETKPDSSVGDGVSVPNTGTQSLVIETEPAHCESLPEISDNHQWNKESVMSARGHYVVRRAARARGRPPIRSSPAADRLPAKNTVGYARPVRGAVRRGAVHPPDIPSPNSSVTSSYNSNAESWTSGNGVRSPAHFVNGPRLRGGGGQQSGELSAACGEYSQFSPPAGPAPRKNCLVRARRVLSHPGRGMAPASGVATMAAARGRVSPAGANSLSPAVRSQMASNNHFLSPTGSSTGTGMRSALPVRSRAAPAGRGYSNSLPTVQNDFPLHIIDDEPILSTVSGPYVESGRGRAHTPTRGSYRVGRGSVVGRPDQEQRLYSSEQQELHQQAVYQDDNDEIQEVEEDCEVVEVPVPVGPGGRTSDRRPAHRPAGHVPQQRDSLQEPG
jgi:hypothetical protein